MYLHLLVRLRCCSYECVIYHNTLSSCQHYSGFFAKEKDIGKDGEIVEERMNYWILWAIHMFKFVEYRCSISSVVCPTRISDWNNTYFDFHIFTSSFISYPFIEILCSIYFMIYHLLIKNGNLFFFISGIEEYEKKSFVKIYQMYYLILFSFCHPLFGILYNSEDLPFITVCCTIVVLNRNT